MRRGAKTRLSGDLYDITGRLKEIDRGYFIVRNGKKNRFEVHHEGQPQDTYCMTLPYDELDARTVQLVLQTRRERLDRLLTELSPPCE